MRRSPGTKVFTPTKSKTNQELNYKQPVQMLQWEAIFVINQSDHITKRWEGRTFKAREKVDRYFHRHWYRDDVQLTQADVAVLQGGTLAQVIDHSPRELTYEFKFEAIEKGQTHRLRWYRASHYTRQTEPSRHVFSSLDMKARRVLIGVRFEGGEVPDGPFWWYEKARRIEGLPRYSAATRLERDVFNYVEHEFWNVKPRTEFGIAWEW